MKIDTPDDTEEPADERPLLSVPVAFALGLVFIVVTLGGGYWLVRARTQPSPDEGVPLATVWARQGTVFPTPTTAATRVPTTAPAPTTVPVPVQQQPAALPTPVPRTTPQPIGAGAATSAQLTATTAAATTIGTPATTRAPEPGVAEPPATPVPTAAPAPQPVEIGAGCLAQAGVPVGPAKEVAGAYLHYFDVRAEALLTLDPVPLDTVSTGEALTGLQEDIQESRAAGRATLIDVQHSCVVLRVDGDEADVADRYRDSSIFVDPVTHQPLPGEVKPASPAEAPEVKVVYRLRRVGSTWKVIGGREYA